eukprot:m.23877 g.23877  ORF g.23877 m.23877 type:complete len:934 (+) comp7551_c0_seq1:202-3003(+)
MMSSPTITPTRLHIPSHGSVQSPAPKYVSTPVPGSSPRKFASKRPDVLSMSYTFGTQAVQRNALDFIRGYDYDDDEDDNDGVRGLGPDLNATYPAPRPLRRGKGRHIKVRGLNKLRGQGLDTFNFSPTPNFCSPASSSRLYNEANSLINSLVASPVQGGNSHTSSNPHKALLTISTTGKVLIANQVACALFGYSSKQIVGKPLSMLVRKDTGGVGSGVVDDLLVDESGDVEQISGRVVAGVHKSGREFSVSLWMRKISGGLTREKRYVCVIEQVIRSEGKVFVSKTIDDKNTEIHSIVDCDDGFLNRFCLSREALRGSSVVELFPALNMNDVGTGKLQHITCHGIGATPIPCSVILQNAERETLEGKKRFAPEGVDVVVLVRVYTALSGLISCQSDGCIYGVNENFLMLLLGYAEQQIVGQNIQLLLPTFFEVTSPTGDFSTLSSNLDTSAECMVCDGTYSTLAKHADGTELAVFFQVRSVKIENGDRIYCIWLSADCLTANLEESLVERLQVPDKTTEINVQVIEKEEFIHGEEGFNKRYKLLDKIGEGSFGFVSRCSALSNGELYVVKFIRKDKILPESWDISDKNIVNLPPLKNDFKPGMIAREALLLKKLDHDNIIKAVDVTHNTEYFHVVMQIHAPPHTPALDLFEFIESNPNIIDERAASFIFRQVVAAVSYLHDQNIVHRDIKDENVILNEKLEAKLIDFGSAAYMSEGKLFDTFCGTIEYCAPEVLLGNPYSGSELDIFSMGVTLYTLLYGENPFCDVEETLQGGFNPPFNASEPCESLMLWILEPDPSRRITIPELLVHPWVTMEMPPVSNKKMNTNPNTHTPTNTSVVSCNDDSHLSIIDFDGEISGSFNNSDPVFNALLEDFHKHNLTNIINICEVEEMDLASVLTLTVEDMTELGLSEADASSALTIINMHKPNKPNKSST